MGVKEAMHALIDVLVRDGADRENLHGIVDAEAGAQPDDTGDAATEAETVGAEETG